MEILGHIFWLGVIGWVWQTWGKASALEAEDDDGWVQGSEPLTATVVREADHEPCDHDYEPLPLTEVVGHLYEKHFEVWNLIGGNDPPPHRWRREHAADHGRVEP